MVRWLGHGSAGCGAEDVVYYYVDVPGAGGYVVVVEVVVSAHLPLKLEVCLPSESSLKALDGVGLVALRTH